MSRPREQLIRTLVEELQPVQHPGRIVHYVAAWLALSWLYTVAILSLTGPWRPGAFAQLLGSPQFALETVLGLAAGTALIVSALGLGIPGPGSAARRSRLGLGAVALWVSSYVLGLWHPALEPSMLGKRELCPFETLLYGAGPLVAGLLLMRRLMPLSPRWAGFMIGLAAGSLPALGMQFACMYEPAHALTHHLFPALVTGAIGAGVAPWLTRPGRTDSPARR